MAAPSKRARTLLIAAGAVVVVVVVAIIIAVSVGADPAVAPGPSGSPSATSATPTPSASDAAPGETAPPADGAAPDPFLGEPVADAVAPDATADFGDRVTARIGSVSPFTAEGGGVGEVSGSAVRVTVAITNGTGAAIPLDSVTVNAFHGSDQTPAAPLVSDTSSTPLAGSLAPGASANGSYAFSVPEGDIDSLVVSVSRGAGSPLVVFGR
jgi:hypothetical protein